MARDPASFNAVTDPRDEDSDLLDVEARETLAADDVAEVDVASEDEELELTIEAHASEDIVSDVDGDDYRAGTLDPEGSDRGPYRELTDENLNGGPARRDDGPDGEARW